MNFVWKFPRFCLWSKVCLIEASDMIIENLRLMKPTPGLKVTAIFRGFATNHWRNISKLYASLCYSDDTGASISCRYQRVRKQYTVFPAQHSFLRFRPIIFISDFCYKIYGIVIHRLKWSNSNFNSNFLLSLIDYLAFRLDGACKNELLLRPVYTCNKKRWEKYQRNSLFVEEKSSTI